jgi:hypothetical protein
MIAISITSDFFMIDVLSILKYLYKTRSLKLCKYY